MKRICKAAAVIALVALVAVATVMNSGEPSKNTPEQVEAVTGRTSAPTLPTTAPEAPEIAEDQPEASPALLTPCGLTATEFEAGLLGALKPYAGCFITAERETGVNAIFLASVAALESGWNTSEVAKERNNLFGWTSKSGYRAFESKEDCIAFVAERVKRNYLSPGGCYFEGYTVEAVNLHYNGAPEWERLINQIMKDIQARISEGGQRR